jgi:hypothetical protein
MGGQDMEQERELTVTRRLIEESYVQVEMRVGTVLVLASVLGAGRKWH